MLTASVIKICSEPTVTACPPLRAETLAEAITCEQMGGKQAQVLLFALAWQVLRRVLILCLTLWHPHHKSASVHTVLMYRCRPRIADNSWRVAAVRFQLVSVSCRPRRTAIRYYWWVRAAMAFHFLRPTSTEAAATSARHRSTPRMGQRDWERRMARPGFSWFWPWFSQASRRIAVAFHTRDGLQSREALGRISKRMCR